MTVFAIRSDSTASFIVNFILSTLGIDLTHDVQVYLGNAEVVEPGRHTILRGWRAKARAGSSPAFGTNRFIKARPCVGLFY